MHTGIIILCMLFIIVIILGIFDYALVDRR